MNIQKFIIKCIVYIFISSLSIGCDAFKSPETHDGLVLTYERVDNESDQISWKFDSGNRQEAKYCNQCKATCSVLATPGNPGTTTLEAVALSPSECVDWAAGKCPTNLIKANCVF